MRVTIEEYNNQIKSLQKSIKEYTSVLNNSHEESKNLLDSLNKFSVMLDNMFEQKISVCIKNIVDDQKNDI